LVFSHFFQVDIISIDQRDEKQAKETEETAAKFIESYKKSAEAASQAELVALEIKRAAEKSKNKQFSKNS
jgi:hypothetical protein